jgi:hypothetical protein
MAIFFWGCPGKNSQAPCRSRGIRVGLAALLKDPHTEPLATIISRHPYGVFSSKPAPLGRDSLQS